MMPLQLELAEVARPLPPKHHISDAAFAFLNHLRFTAMACRSKPRADLFQACALLHVTPTATHQAHADALVRCLGEALGKQPKMHAPGTVEMSFDECWLVQLGEAMAQSDDSSVAFLLSSRVRSENRRLIRFLICRTSKHFALH